MCSFTQAHRQTGSISWPDVIPLPANQLSAEIFRLACWLSQGYVYGPKWTQQIGCQYDVVAGVCLSGYISVGNIYSIHWLWCICCTEWAFVKLGVLSAAWWGLDCQLGCCVVLDSQLGCCVVLESQLDCCVVLHSHLGCCVNFGELAGLLCCFG